MFINFHTARHFTYTTMQQLSNVVVKRLLCFSVERNLITFFVESQPNSKDFGLVQIVINVILICSDSQL